jgi:hypothetical protein
MTHELLRHHPEYETTVIFANTGQEREETLIFVQQCADHWGWNVVWVEAVVQHGKRQASAHRVVDYASASRDGAPFEDVITKYGIPNHSYPHCTRELKLNPMKSYLASQGWDDYQTAVGIRADEARRRSPGAEKKGVVYPLIDWFPTTKDEVNDWWGEQPFRLKLEAHQGNCSWCWKKSFRKHMQLLDESPDIYDFPERMEAEHGLAGHNVDGTRRVFFRGHRSTQHLRGMQELIGSDCRMPGMDEDSGCSESCDIYAELR